MPTLLATGNGVHRLSGDDGDWTTGHALTDRRVNCLLVHPTEPGVVFAGTQDDGLFQSTDGGRSWSSLGLAGRVVKSLAASPAEPDRLYAGTKPPLVYRSEDGGETWCELVGFRDIPWRRLWFSPAEPPYSAYVQGLAVSPTDPDVVLAGIEFGAVVRSTDGGETWSGHRRGAIRDCHTLAFHRTEGTYVYEGGAGFRGRGAAWSRDAGATWGSPTAGLDRTYGWACASDPQDPDTWYVSASTGAMKAHGEADARAFVYRYTGEDSWERLGGGLPQPLDHMPYAVCPDPTERGHLYVGLSNGDVWHSVDRGHHWSRLTASFPEVRRAMVLLSS